MNGAERFFVHFGNALINFVAAAACSPNRAAIANEVFRRADGVVVFKPLSMTDVIKIARILIDKVIKNLEEKGITFEVTDSAVSELAELGFDPKYGARPLRRVIQNKIDDELAKLLLENKIKRRDKVVLDTGGEIKIVKADEL